jgi:hypothetical protein
MQPNKKIIAILIISIFYLLGLSPTINAQIDINNIISQKSNINPIINNELFETNFLNSKMRNDGKEYWALLMAINDYPGSNDLPYSINEILSFKTTLLNGGNWLESNIKVLTDDEVNITGIDNAINWLSMNADEDDITIIYYAGHGGQSSTNEHINVINGSISDIELNDKLESIPGKTIVIIDACHSGGFIQELKQRNRIILTACRKDNLTYQYTKFKSGIFGYFLNLSLDKYTKNIETAFIFTFFASVYYTNKLSDEFGEDYTIYPQMYDGTLLITKIINKHSYRATFIMELLSLKTNNKLNLWRM